MLPDAGPLRTYVFLCQKFEALDVLQGRLELVERMHEFSSVSSMLNSVMNSVRIQTNKVLNIIYQQ